jgi:hypothetical protein
MTDDRKSAIFLIAGSLGGILTMAIHPHGSAGLTAAEADHLALTSAIAHTLAMVSFLAIFLGACGITRRLAARPGAANDRLAFGAIVTYAFAAVAIFIAAAVDGFILPTLMRHMTHDIVSAVPIWHVVIDAVFQINQSFARIYTVVASIAIVLWSASALRNGGIGRGIAAYGCISSAVLTLLIAVGHLKFNIHGMAAVVICQAIWFVVIAVQLLRRVPIAPPTAA